jgi:CRISPR-associated protein Cas2
MRQRYLVCYDIADPRRLDRTHKKLTGFGQAVQYSVFVCDLSPTERVLLEAALTALLNLGEDRVLIVDLGPTEGRGSDCVTVLGRQAPLPQRGPTIV